MNHTILITSANVNNWGAERSTCSLAHHLMELGNRVIVVIPREGEIIDILNDYKLEYIIHPYSVRWGTKRNLRNILRKTLYNRLYANRLKKELKRRNITPDLIYTNILGVSFGLLLSKLYGIPHIQHIRENVHAFGYLFDWGYRFTMRNISRNSEHIICTCHTIKKYYINDFPEDRLHVVHNGIPIKDQPVQKDAEGPIRIVQIARFMPDKRLEDSILGLEKSVKSGYTQLKFDIYGAGPQEEYLKELVAEKGLTPYVEFKGFCRDIDLTPYHIGLMTSTFEAFARSTIDYMMNGLAVLASNTGGNIEQVQDGNTGYLYRMGDPDDFAKKLNMLCADRNRTVEMGMNGYEYAKAHFSQDAYTNGCARFFIETLTGNNRKK